MKHTLRIPGNCCYGSICCFREFSWYRVSNTDSQNIIPRAQGYSIRRPAFIMECNVYYWSIDRRYVILFCSLITFHAGRNIALDYHCSCFENKILERALKELLAGPRITRIIKWIKYYCFHFLTCENISTTIL